jgi:hypothetical protein
MIDLRNAKPGDRFLTRDGRPLTYVACDETAEFWPHFLKYDDTIERILTTRTDDGYFDDALRKSDRDIVEIL